MRFTASHSAAQTRSRYAVPQAENHGRNPPREKPGQAKNETRGNTPARYVPEREGNPALTNYSEIASIGHTVAQTPHEMHFSASMTYLSSPSEMASFGQLPAQEPQLMHWSEIT